MEKIDIKIRQKAINYPIFIGCSTINLLKNFLIKQHRDKKVVVITDDNIKKLCEDNLISILKEFNPYLITIQPGESSKSREIKEKVEDMLLKKKYGRGTVIIAFGGGVTGDLVGFTASTYNRGVPLIHVPTTLLAMVDSSIGGKNSINTKHGKNLIGTIYQPTAVFIDINFLDSLPNEEFLNGMAEIIKIAITSDKELFNFIKKNHKKILEKDEKALLYIIKKSIELKKDIIEKDEKEAGLRQILNFGHTVGHALEAYYSYKIKHGYCVSQGIVLETKISNLTGNLNKKEEGEIVSLLKKIGLPNNNNNYKNIDFDKLIDFMKLDKKARNQKPRFVILKRIGKIKSDKNNFSFEIDEEIIRQAMTVDHKVNN